MDGYCGRVLRVDLTAQTATEEPFDADVAQAVLGGAGLGAYYLYREVGPESGPFDEGNLLVFATGPLQATSLPGSAKWAVCARSPMSNGYGEAAAGAHWGIALRRAGFDAVVVRGTADQPCLLTILDGKAELRPADHLWGQTTDETLGALQSALNDDELSVAAIGPAGEALVRYACIMVDGHSAAGRTGMGSVMGAKRLKAICISGGREASPVADAERLRNLQKGWLPEILEGSEILRTKGTVGFMDILDGFGDVPTKNWQLGHWPEGNPQLAWGEYEKINVKGVPCAHCPIACHRYVRVDNPVAYRMEGPGPEYETLAMLGQNCLIADLAAVAKGNDLCNAYGLDSISAGASIAFAMECYEKGYLSAKTADGLHLEWGNAEAMISLLHAIAERKGIGDLLAEGVVRAADAIHSETRAFAVATKGVEHPAHDPRAFFAHSINYMTGVRGACHERGNMLIPCFGVLLPEMGIAEKPDPSSMDRVPYLVAKYQDWSSFWNSLVICRFMGVSFNDMVDGLNAATGWGWSVEQAALAAERIFNLQRLVGMRFGITAKDDVLPPRALEPTREGPHAGKVPQGLAEARQEYYRIRGWDADGVPTKGTLDRLGLGSMI